MPRTTFTVEVEQEEDGRWICEIPQLPGVISYGGSREESIAKAEALAWRVLADARGIAFQAMSHRHDADATFE
jgi:predicted RNase H-like HicB family nuclease